jgi:hypothetical protein
MAVQGQISTPHLQTSPVYREADIAAASSPRTQFGFEPRQEGRIAGVKARAIVPAEAR